MADIVALAETIVGLTLKEAKEISDELKDKHGIEPAAAGAVMMAGPGDGGGDAEPTSFDVMLESAGEKKIQVIKAVREITGLGLKEAKAVVDAAPKSVKDGVSKEEADTIKAKIEEAGGAVSLKGV